ncbi:hypothetical protein SAMN04489764_0903 [Thermostaphylospora chromogena]|uniref:Adhesin n=1 Tax=Thermostaphylospora chromogena TaxID=35622 RepID=A0A1H1BCN0_9ACTN|nr:hypothetical protein SAMN04489764_0903 [Thermostaphylospora chromogena]
MVVMKRNRGVAVTAAIAVIAALTGCAEMLDAPEVHAARAFPHSGKTLTITSSLGSMRIMPGETGTVRVDRWLRGKASKNGASSWSLRDGTLYLSADCSQVFGDCGGRYRIKVPPGVELVVEGGDDAVVLSGLAQDVKVTNDGAIRAVKTTGRLLLMGGDGSITGEDLSSAEVRARTADGAISLDFIAPPTTVDARTDEGKVTVAVPRNAYAVTAESAEGSARSRIKSVESDRTIVARSGSGNVLVKAAESS